MSKATNQSSDHEQGGGASGTKLTSVTPRNTSVKGAAPSTKNPSGSSQSDSRGKQG
jgi:hypothetical protein